MTDLCSAAVCMYLALHHLLNSVAPPRVRHRTDDGVKCFCNFWILGFPGHPCEVLPMTGVGATTTASILGEKKVIVDTHDHAQLACGNNLNIITRIQNQSCPGRAHAMLLLVILTY